MITINIQDDIKEATRWLSDIQKKQIPFATSVAINKTMREVHSELTREMSVFDRPKSYTQGGVFYKKSDKRDLTSVVGLKARGGMQGIAGSKGAPLNEYLDAQIEAGTRADKRSEILLQRAGILPAGYQTRPGSGASIDRWGNMSKGQIVAILSYFRTFGLIKESGRFKGRDTQSAKLNRGTRTRAVEYFVVPEGMPGLATGIWRRQGRKIEPILIFIRPAIYQKRYDFYGVATKVIRSKLDRHFNEAMAHALATAR